jgi:hypothetical protein
MRPSMSTEHSNIATDREENGNELFLQAGLDDPNQIESIQKIVLKAKLVFSFADGRAERLPKEFIQFTPAGQIRK